MPATLARYDHHRSPARRPRLVPLLATLLWLSCALPGAAALPLEDPALASARADFLAAERALAGGQLTTYRRLLTGLQDYPLLVYLRIAELGRRFTSASDKEIAALLEEYDDTPPANALRTRWLQRAGERRDWPTLLAGWRSQRNTELQCLHARALFEVGRRIEAMAATRELWLSGRSQPDACDSAFRRWRDGGGLDEALVWRRVALAAAGGETRLVRYLRKLLPPADAALAELWLELRSKPALVAEGRRFLPDRARSREVRHDGLKRLARRHPAKAAQAWQDMQERHAWSDAERADALRAIGLGYAQEHLAEGGAWLDRVDDDHADERVWEWRATSRLRERDWSRLAAVIDRMPAALRGGESWRYWRARAAEHLGEQQLATAGYDALAGQRSFHGFLAADRLGRGYDFGAQPLRFDDGEMMATAAIPGVARARELLALDRELEARREWYAALDVLDDATLQRAARLAQLWGWHTQAIFTVARASHFDDIELRFPILYAAEIATSARALGIEPAWVLAVIRQESAFMADARSPAGALGLMQIMPATGRSIARSLGVEFGGSRTLLDPPTSIRFGAHYLRTLLDRFAGHPALAVAAYNAGPHRAERWRPTDGDMEADIWIDTVPYAETRRYLQRVFYYTAIYEHRMGLEPTPLRTRLRAVPGRAPSSDLSRP